MKLIADVRLVLSGFYKTLRDVVVVAFAWFKPSTIMQNESVVLWGHNFLINVCFSGCIVCNHLYDVSATQVGTNCRSLNRCLRTENLVNQGRFAHP